MELSDRERQLIKDADSYRVQTSTDRRLSRWSPLVGVCWLPIAFVQFSEGSLSKGLFDVTLAGAMAVIFYLVAHNRTLLDDVYPLIKKLKANLELDSTRTV
jgi:hypothetical protein